MAKENTAKNFALQLGSVVALYVSIGSLLALLFGIITVAYPDTADSYYTYDSASSQIRFSIATLIVFFPTYLVLTRFVNKTRRRETGAYLTLTKWLIYLSLLVAGAVLLGDLVAVVNAFLNGELAIRFMLKALSVFVVVGVAFLYYALDAKGYWQTHEKESIQYGGVAAVLVLAIVVLGFFNTELPSEVREMRIDDQQVRDLQDAQWRIEEYYRVNGELPENLSDAFIGSDAPTAADERRDYEYHITENGFELCAEFAHDSDRREAGLEPSLARPVLQDRTVLIKNPNNWDYRAGWWCFERAIEAPITN